MTRENIFLIFAGEFPSTINIDITKIYGGNLFKVLVRILKKSYQDYVKSDLTFTPLSFDLFLYNIDICLKVVSLTIITLQFLFEAQSL